MKRKKLGNTLSLSKGFTLIELLVVISIIAILATVGLVGLTGSQKQARDTIRRNDLSQYRTALENYYATNSEYVLSEEVAKAATALTDPLDNYMTAFPVDSKTSGNCDFSGTDYNYCYITNNVGGKATEFVLAARLETGKCYYVCGINNAQAGGKAGVLDACVDFSSAVCPTTLH